MNNLNLIHIIGKHTKDYKSYNQMSINTYHNFKNIIKQYPIKKYNLNTTLKSFIIHYLHS